ncbi:TVP38/TMEM64 family protein [Anaerofustis sp. NSJ-163]|uniref:TVP38/TMEM64 family protein n=1 Tax=Anaerofustis sp. NSJ-163 TaxID=2944391 RepID=UPI00209BC321|nr:VTT domain-containing protein [Anaerofustis sp. NSJ-163]MCO8193141.1 VTT domain-containing protein [Anaerofustis sp. NSJ-163]
MNKKKIALISIISIAVLVLLGIFFTLDINKILEYAKSMPHGIKELFMILIVTLQIFIAFIPGEPIELAAGYMFGSLWGTIICLIGSFLGTIVVYYLVKTFGSKVINLMFKKEQIKKVEGLFEKKKNLMWIFILFLIPGTPKDVMTYLVSLTNIKLYRWLIVTTIGRIPSIITSTFITGSIREQNYLMAIIVGVITVFLVVFGFFYYKKLNNTSKS